MGKICQGAPAGHQTALESCCHSPDKYFETLLSLGGRSAGIRGHTVKKGGVARLQGEVRSVLQCCLEQLLCTEVSNVHLLAGQEGRSLALVTVPVPGLIKAGPR